jgi:hypothetical protein
MFYFISEFNYILTKQAIIERFKLIQFLCVVVLEVLFNITNLFFRDLSTNIWEKIICMLPISTIAFSILDISNLIDLVENDLILLVLIKGLLSFSFHFI